jgi:hypothetical protein
MRKGGELRYVVVTVALPSHGEADCVVWFRGDPGGFAGTGTEEPQIFGLVPLWDGDRGPC